MPIGPNLADVTAAVVPIVSIDVPLPPLTVAELKLHLGDTDVAGATAQVRFTAELNPALGVMVTMDVAEAPAVTDAGESGAAARANDADAAVAVTIKAAVAVAVKVPELPVMLKSKFPAAVGAAVVTVSGVLTCPLPVTATDVGEQETPDGNPEHAKVTVPLNPG